MEGRLSLSPRSLSPPLGVVHVVGEQRISSMGAISFPIVTRFENFRSIDGVALPSRYVSALPQSGDMVVEIENVELVTDAVDEKLFRLETTSK